MWNVNYWECIVFVLFSVVFVVLCMVCFAWILAAGSGPELVTGDCRTPMIGACVPPNDLATLDFYCNSDQPFPDKDTPAPWKFECGYSQR